MSNNNRYIVYAKLSVSLPDSTTYIYCNFPDALPLSDLGANLVKPYKINERTVNQVLELRHGNAVKTWAMDKVSNATFSEREYDRLVRVYESEKIKLPTKRQLEKKAEQLHKLATQPMTESDINAMLLRKSQLASNKLTGTALTMERSRLAQARTLALRRQDHEEVKQLDERIAELDLEKREKKEEGSVEDLLAKVNERNRKANAETLKNIAAREERKRRERKLAMAANGGSATPKLLGSRYVAFFCFFLHVDSSPIMGSRKLVVKTNLTNLSSFNYSPFDSARCSTDQGHQDSQHQNLETLHEASHLCYLPLLPLSLPRHLHRNPPPASRTASRPTYWIRSRLILGISST